eukprot:3365181-Amphidinium_carterae.1
MAPRGTYITSPGCNSTSRSGLPNISMLSSVSALRPTFAPVARRKASRVHTLLMGTRDEARISYGTCVKSLEIACARRQVPLTAPALSIEQTTQHCQLTQLAVIACYFKAGQNEHFSYFVEGME